MSQMKTVASYVSTRHSMSYVMLDGLLRISIMRLLPNGELDHDHETFSGDYQDGTVAARVYCKLEAILKACDHHRHWPMKSVVRDYALEAAKA